MIVYYDKLPRVEIVSVIEEQGFHEFNVYGWTRSHLYEDPSQLLVNRFKVGDVDYVVNHALSANYEPPVGGNLGRFVVTELVRLRGLMEGIEFIGRGKSLKIAKWDWQSQVDTAIQRLFAIQDFERTANEEKLWRGLGRHFDLNTIRYSIPLKIRSYGVLEGIRGHRYLIRWIDCRRVDRLNRKDIPNEMVAFRPGQPFEAVVLRNARDWKLIRIESAFAAKSLPSNIDEAAHLLNPEIDERKYPDVDWD